MKEEYIFFRRNGKLMRFPKKGKTKLYRGLSQEYDPNYDKSKLDNVNGYESWTDNPELAKEYAGENGYVYSVEVPNKDLNTEDIFDENGDRSLVYWNDKPVALHGVEGEEFMLYTNHDDHEKLEYKEISSPENEDRISEREFKQASKINDPLDRAVQMAVSDKLGYEIDKNTIENSIDIVRRNYIGDASDQEIYNKLKSEFINRGWYQEDQVVNRSKETETKANDLEEAFTIKEQTGEKVYQDGKEIKEDKDNKRKQNAEMNKVEKKEEGISKERAIQLSDRLYGANMATLKEIAREVAPNWNLEKYSSDSLKDKQQLYMMLLRKLNQMKK